MSNGDFDQKQVVPTVQDNDLTRAKSARASSRFRIAICPVLYRKRHSRWRRCELPQNFDVDGAWLHSSLIADMPKAGLDRKKYRSRSSDHGNFAEP